MPREKAPAKSSKKVKSPAKSSKKAKAPAKSSKKEKAPAKASKKEKKDIVAAAAAAAPQSTGDVKYWTKDEDDRLSAAVKTLCGKNWKQIALTAFPNKERSDIQCLHRWKKVLRPGLKKGPWLPTEDRKVLKAVLKVGINKVKWSEVATQVPGRLGKQVRERWYNHLDPTLNKSPWLPSEDKLLVKLQKQFGNKWVKIAEKMPGRSENGIKNRWNSAKRRRGGVDKRKGSKKPRKGSKSPSAKAAPTKSKAAPTKSKAAPTKSRKRKSAGTSGNAEKKRKYSI